jgi:hypothetical protein
MKLLTRLTLTKMPIGFVPMSGTPAVQQGEGFFQDIGNGFKKAFNWVKDNHIVSSTIGALAPGAWKAAAIPARAIGLGKKRRGARAAPRGAQLSMIRV